METQKPDVREKALEHGLSFPSDEELVMLMLGSGTKQLPVRHMAHKIVDTLNGSNADNLVDKLLAVKGVGAGKALAVAAGIELGKRRSIHLKAQVQSAADIVPYVQHYAICDKEHFLSVLLNGSNEILQIHVVTVGTVNNTLVHAREIFKSAITENAASLILCHNHPSGNCMPSDDDIETTEALLVAARIIGIDIIDHIIISTSSYFSFMEQGILFSERL